MKRSSRDLALCGVLCALAVAIMAMGTILPAATYCCPVLASMTLVPVLILCGERLSWAMFAASAILSLLFAPDKEAAAIFLALGYYPIVKPKLDRKPKPRRIAGDITGDPAYKAHMMRLQVEERYTVNSKGESVPIKEVAWGTKDDVPTHLLLQFTSSHGGAYIGSPGNSLWIDNVKLVY